VPRVTGYRRDGEIARSPRAVVYRATRVDRGRVVALKVLTPAAWADLGRRERFRAARPAVVGADLPGVVPVLDADEAGGTGRLAMRLIDGAPLSRALGDPAGVEVRRTLAILRQVADALDGLAARGLAHGAVGEGAVLLAPGDRALLTPPLPPGPGATPAGDRRALAALAAAALSGEPPGRLGGPVPRPSARIPGLGAAVDAVVARGMSADPRARHASAAAFAADLESAIAATPGASRLRPARHDPAAVTMPIPAPPPPSAPPPAPVPAPAPSEQGRRWRVPAIVAAVLVALVAISTAVALTGGDDDATTGVVPLPALPAAPAPSPAPATPRPLLPHRIPGWVTAAVDPAVVNLGLPARGEAAAVQARRGADVALVAGLRPRGEDGRVTVERIRARVAGVPAGIVPLRGLAGQGTAQRSGAGWVVTFAGPRRVVVVVAGSRPIAVELAQRLSIALRP
jgi:hypothetical protein